MPSGMEPDDESLKLAGIAIWSDYRFKCHGAAVHIVTCEMVAAQVDARHVHQVANAVWNGTWQQALGEGVHNSSRVEDENSA